MDALYNRKLNPEDAALLSHLLVSASPAYRMHFFPFSDESPAQLKKILSAYIKDICHGIFRGESLLGFYLLRGWDEGYTRPSFGVFISEEYAGFGLGKLAMVHAISECRLRKTASMMLKVSQENIRAKYLYESYGFQAEGVCDLTGHMIMHLELSNEK